MGGDPAPGGTVPVSAQCPPCRARGAPCVGAGGSAALLLRWQRLQTQPAPGPDAGGISHALLSSLRGGGGRMDAPGISNMPVILVSGSRAKWGAAGGGCSRQGSHPEPPWVHCCGAKRRR